ncbi:MAG: hypothetical protein UU81_C0003G0005 [Microgenomates group bacterium GW2011_GWC1_41_8]|uniref:Uncharacterized protein n=2 Tax=Candidatus Roizmaniibacteriota TaxID=1752723 RepID=A0A0G0W9P4_9BACT|nr:MAG: hypothetical protein UU14_C0015G0002 [Candidatus Roizmanbacteria bacterium GW2011_GWB1_40_7]KKR94706.1 MAG: hypothetical protein UU41_C0004G0006 [Candidatus Roizmanbacteria bacterium GW2011_GWA1_41_13]KKS24689.1 MAG: hypothetical protein UU81_C0003G0005 [Microgenomates group bacterium GW2011_GWC1_41_8]
MMVFSGDLSEPIANTKPGIESKKLKIPVIAKRNESIPKMYAITNLFTHFRVKQYKLSVKDWGMSYIYREETVVIWAV